MDLVVTYATKNSQFVPCRVRQIGFARLPWGEYRCQVGFLRALQSEVAIGCQLLGASLQLDEKRHIHTQKIVYAIVRASPSHCRGWNSSNVRVIGRGSKLNSFRVRVWEQEFPCSDEPFATGPIVRTFGFCERPWLISDWLWLVV